jgi:hypothetical protein
MKNAVLIVCLSLLLSVLCHKVDGQECKDCKVQSIRFLKPKFEKSCLPARKLEEVGFAREVFDGGVSRLKDRPRRLKAFNWGCVASAVGAYFNCANSKRERLGLLKRIFDRR